MAEKPNICKCCGRHYGGRSWFIRHQLPKRIRCDEPWLQMCEECLQRFMDWTQRKDVREGFDENGANKFIAVHLALLAHRVARGDSVLPCEAVPYSYLPEHKRQCLRFGAESVNGRWLCHVHARKERLAKPADKTRDFRAKGFILADTADEFLEQVTAIAPADWLHRLAASIPASPGAGE